MKYEAVIFDLDGTLTDSAPGITSSLRHALEMMQLAFPGDEVVREFFLGPPLLSGLYNYYGMEGAVAAETVNYFRLRYHESGYLENAVFPGIRDLLSELQKQDCYLAVATGKPQSATEKILDALNLRGFFSAVSGPLEQDDPLVDKAEMIRRVLPEGKTAVMVGDRDTDILAAKHMGLSSIGVTFGYGTQAEIEKAAPEHMAQTPEELFGLLGIGKPERKGYFISFEGNDGAGKSTQARFLAQRLVQCGYEVQLTREPGGSPMAEQIREILLSNANTDIKPVTEALLYAAARAQHVRDVIKPALDAGKIIISDRFVDSSIAYQGAGRGLGIERVRQMNAPAVDGVMPSATVFLALSPEAAEQRQHARTKDRLELEGAEFHQRVADAYQSMIAAEPERFLVIQATGKKQETAEKVFNAVIERLGRDGVA